MIEIGYLIHWLSVYNEFLCDVLRLMITASDETT